MKRSRVDLFRWIDEPGATRHAIHVASEFWTWQSHSYEEIGGLTLPITNGLHQLKIRRNDVIAIVLPTGAEFVAAVFGTMLAGAIPCVLAPIRAFQDQRSYQHHLMNVVQTADPKLILTSAEFAPALTAIVEKKVSVMVVNELLKERSSSVVTACSDLADIALLQFTAGSTGQCRGVRISYSALEANVAAIRRWLNWSESDAAAFWVPHYHDMGLIGGVFAPLASGCDLWLLTPEQFIRRPIEYMRCFGEWGGRLTALPAFGLDYIVRRVRSDDISQMDFSEVKAFVIGAELIEPSTLIRFADLLEPFGLRRGTLLPAYGLAEATLAVTGVPLGESWSARTVEHGERHVVGCGPPLSDIEVSIVDEDRLPVADGQCGEIVIRGASVAFGCNTQSSDSHTSLEDGKLYSGDAGFICERQLFPIGRLGDSIKIRGRSLFAEALEAELHQLGYGREHNVVLLGVGGGRTIVVWLAERLASNDHGEALRLVQRLAEGAEVFLLRTKRGVILRTSSGKPRRRILWTEFINNRIPGKLEKYSP